jgi:hypothetical protein
MARIVGALTLVLGLLLGVPARAALIELRVSLDGTQAGTGSPGTGSALLQLDDVAETLSVDLEYDGLLSPTNNAHIHCCAPPGSNAGVIIPFVPPFVLGGTSGTFTQLFDLDAMQVAQVRSGLSYINIHTDLYPAGEIRGQIVPEAGTMALLGAGAVALIAGRRRRHR